MARTTKKKLLDEIDRLTMPKVEIIYEECAIWSGTKWEKKKDPDKGGIIQYRVVRELCRENEWKSELQNELRYICDTYPNISKITFIFNKGETNC